MALLDIKKIRRDGGTQSRVKKHDEAIADYTDAYIEDAKMPPVEVIFDGTDYWLWDGHHRVEAAQAAGKKGINVNIVRGTLREAFLKSLGANAENGMRRTNDDKLNVVKAALQDAEVAALSTREIAKICRVSHAMVSKHKNGTETTGQVSTVDSYKAGKRRGQLSTVDSNNLSESGQSTNEEAGEMTGETGAKAPGPVTTRRPKVEVAGNVVELVRERDEFAAKNAELAFFLGDTMEELRVVKEGIALGDVVAAMATENTALRKRIGELEDIINGLTEEKNAAIRQAVSWQKKAKAK